MLLCLFLCIIGSNIQASQQKEQAAPAYAEVAGNPPPSDFGCSTSYDAVDFAPDGLQYYFMGQYLYTEDPTSRAVVGPRRIVDYFSGLTLPVIVAFSTGPLNSLMYILDSSRTTNLKVFKFTASSPYPRTVVMESHLAAVFPNSTNIPSPLKAAFSSFTPPKVWFFGDEAPRHQVATYAYNTAAGTFTYTGMATPGWHDVTVTSASMWPDNHSKSFQNFLYNGSKVAQVDANLAMVAGPANHNSCPKWRPDRMTLCCGVAAHNPVASHVIKAPPSPLLDCKVFPDSIDLAPDDNYYFFTGPYLYTANKFSHEVSQPVLISTRFADIVPPVIAAFSTGPLNAKMFLIDSSKTNNVKLFAVGNDTLPRTAISSGMLKTFFPSGASIPQPLTAAAATHNPSRVYFFGGNPLTVFMYNFNMMENTFTPLAVNKILGTMWPTDVVAATMSHLANNGASEVYAFDKTRSVAKINANLQILRGPSVVANCNDWWPKVISPSCCWSNHVVPPPPPVIPAVPPPVPDFVGHFGNDKHGDNIQHLVVYRGTAAKPGGAHRPDH